MATKKKGRAPKARGIEIRMRLADGRRAEATQLWNISLGGIFVEMNDPLPFGVDVAIDFSLPTEPRSLRCEGFVVWSTKNQPEKARGKTGAAIRLTSIGISEMRHLSEAVGRDLEG